MTVKRKDRVFNIVLTVFIAIAALAFILPTVLTIANSFMTSNEIAANYGAMFGNMNGSEHTFISEDVNLKFILASFLHICESFSKCLISFKPITQSSSTNYF